MVLFLYLLSLAALLGIVLFLAMRKGMLYFPIYFYLYLAGFHIGLPVVLMSAPDSFLSIMPRQFLLGLMDPMHYVTALILVWSAAACFMGGWKVAGYVPLVAGRRTLGERSNVREGRLAVMAGWALLGAGAIGFVLYFNAFGGIFSALEGARAYRTGALEIDNPLSFMRPIGDFAKVALVVFVALWLSGFRSAAVVLGLLVSLVLAFLMTVFQGGRLTFVILICLVLLMFVSDGFLSIRRAAVIGAIAAVLLFFGYQVIFFFYALAGGEELQIPGARDSMSPLEFFVVEMSFPAVGLATALDSVNAGDVPLRYGVDVVYGLVSIVPARFLEWEFESIGAIHTTLSNPFGQASIPVDMVTYGVYAGHVVGPGVFAFLVAIVVRVSFRYLARIGWGRVRFALQLYFFLLFARHLVYFDPAASINSMYFLILGAVFIYALAPRGHGDEGGAGIELRGKQA